MASRAPLPTGAVTFAFTDIEGSTARWERNRPAMQEAVRKHDAILRATIEEHGGHVFKTIGDAFCAAFARPNTAIEAMIGAQRRLAAEDFTAIDGLRVRVALHTGLADERDDDYFGPTLNRVARLLAIGHGGQILVSTATRELTHTHLPTGAHLVDLGFQQLRDLMETERVWQLNVAGLPNAFPPLRSVGSLPNNLPVQRASFVGRDDDVTDVKKLLQQHRMLTLLGSGGVGKTRLAVHVGAEVLDRYRDGVWFVDLAPIGDPALVASVTSQALGMSQGARVEDTIPQWLRPKQLLLILDNCEHVVETAASLASAILATAPEVSILATSRQGLNINGEAHHRLPSLAVPADGAGLTADDALTYGAIALFVDRAKAVDTRFTLSDQTAPAVADICRRLDGIALAIELAAARIRMLSLSNLAERLNERFKILTGGSRDVLPRQKTLMALIDWSYDLLTPAEQRLFARLGVFAGGFALDAVAFVCGGDLDEMECFDLLASLADKSLIVADTSGEQERYRLLESTCAYALDKLSAMGERDRMTRRHAEYFSEQARTAEERYGSVDRAKWLVAVAPDLDNHRATLEWTLTHGNDVALGGAHAAALAGFWVDTSLRVEARYWIDLALAQIDTAQHPQTGARLNLALSFFTEGVRQLEAAERALELFERVGDLRGSARARRDIGLSLLHAGRLEEGAEYLARGIADARACGDVSNATHCTAYLAAATFLLGDFDTARDLFRQSLAGLRTLGDEVGAAIALCNLGELEFAAGNPAESLRLTSEAFESDTARKTLEQHPGVYNNLAAYRLALGGLAEARDLARKALRLAQQERIESQVANAVQYLALLSALAGEVHRAARLVGYADSQYRVLELQRVTTDQWASDKLLAALREKLSADEIEQLAAEGAAWAPDDAIEEALEV